MKNRKSTAMSEYPEDNAATNNLFGIDNGELNLNFAADDNMAPDDQDGYYDYNYD